jgi:hypothetical protein
MRKYDSLIHMKELGLNVGELREFDYSQKKEMYEYARHLFEKYGGLICRTDFPPHINKKPVGLPYLTDCKDFKVFDDFVKTHKDKYTYILLQMIGNEKLIIAAYVYLDDFRRLRGEMNDVDRIGDMRVRMKVTKNLKSVCVGPGGEYDERMNKVRSDLIRARIPPHMMVELAIYEIDGKPTPFYKQMRGDF